MKKLIILVLVFILAFAVTSCQTSDSNYITLKDTPIVTVFQSPLSTPTLTSEVIPSPTISSTDTPSPTNTPESTRTPLEPIRTLESGTEIYTFGGGSGNFEFDLDGNGTLDSISFEFRGASEPVPEGTLTLNSTTEDMYSYDINQCIYA